MNNRIAGLYLHIPFCQRKCTYCNFNTTDFSEDLAPRYIKAVAQEIRYWGARLACEKADINASGLKSPAKAVRDSNFGQLAADDRQKLFIDTIYFGGGTPSIVEADELAELLEACRSHFEVACDAEITIEINPATLSRKKLEGWLDAGINRASVGVQSFLDTELVSLSRTHNTRQARQTLDRLREAGFANLSLDLIAGLPSQSKADWQHNLRQALEIRPEHLSLYLLEVKEGTQLYGQIKRGLRPQPDDDLAAQMYEMISAATIEAGYDHYEISNFALAASPGNRSFRARHNLKYWTDAPFFGLGCGAHSYDGRRRWVNTCKTESYIAEIAARGQAIQECRELDDKERATEAIFMALRLAEGVHLESFRAAYGLDVLQQYDAELARLMDAGLVTIAEGRLRLTPRGRLLSNEVFLIFV